MDRKEGQALNLLRQIIEAFDSHNLEMNSPDITVSDEHPPHPWHEEWLHHARALLESPNDRH